jgi:hypothetical protein
MTSSSERRLSELQELRTTDPAQIVAIYKDVAGIPLDGQLPYGISFASMIDAIVAFEEQRDKDLQSH